MIADSDKTVWEEFKKAFADTDYRLIFSERGEDALQQIVLFRPDLVIAGVTLSGKGGLQLCKEMKSARDSSHIPFLLLKGTSDEVSDQDRERVHADGIISTPLRKEEMLHLVRKLKVEGAMNNKKESLSSELDRLDEDEIIELVDVVEEPESKVSIGDLMGSEKEELLGDITPLETWEKPAPREVRPPQDELALSFEEEAEEKPKPEKLKSTDLRLRKEAPPPEDLFGNVNFEDLLKKVEEIRPSIPEEPVETGVTGVPREEFSDNERSAEKFFSLEEFETALHKGGSVTHAEDTGPSFAIEQPKTEAPVEIPSLHIPDREKRSKPAAPPPKTEKDAQASRPPEAEEDFQALFKEEPLEEISVDASSAEMPVEEVLSELPEEEFPEALLEEELEEEEMSLVEMPAQLQKPEAVEADHPSDVFEEEELPAAAASEKSAEDLIEQGIQVMMDDFVKRVVPEIARNIMSLTMERVEQMVKEVVPELAGKAIQEEIRRLQKGEKD